MLGTKNVRDKKTAVSMKSLRGGVLLLLVLVIAVLIRPWSGDNLISVAVADIVRGDTSNYLIFTSGTPVDSVYIKGYFSSQSTADFTDTLAFISGTKFSFRKKRTFSQIGQWKFEVLYTDTAGTDAQHTTYKQWSNDQVYPDSTAFHGAASGLTTGAIWHYGDGTDTGRTVTGFGGWGNRKLTITVKDGAAVPIQGVEIKVYVGTANKGGSKLTLANGTCVFYIAPSNTYEIRISHNNYSFTTPVTFITNANLTDTTLAVTGTLFNPGAAPSSRLVRIYGTFWDIVGGTPAGVIAKFELAGARKIWFKTVAVTPYSRIDTTDAAGYWEVNLLVNDSLTPTTNFYEATFIDTAGVVSTYTFKVPADSSGKAWQFTPTR